MACNEQEPTGNGTTGHQTGGAEPPVSDLGDFTASLGVVVSRGIADILAPHDMVPVEFSLLRACLRLGECTATQLAEVVPTDPSRISRIVNRLVDLGILSRRRLVEDRRVVMLNLTDQGRELVTQLDERARVFYATLTEDISPEDLAAFAATVSRIVENYHRLQR